MNRHCAFLIKGCFSHLGLAGGEEGGGGGGGGGGFYQKIVSCNW